MRTGIQAGILTVFILLLLGMFFLYWTVRPGVIFNEFDRINNKTLNIAATQNSILKTQKYISEDIETHNENFDFLNWRLNHLSRRVDGLFGEIKRVDVGIERVKAKRWYGN